MKDKYIDMAHNQIDKFGEPRKHWSRYFYGEAKEEGFKFAVRQHIPNFSDAEASLHKLADKEEMWKLPFIKSWEESEIFEGTNLPKDHPESFEKWEVKKYADDGEQLLICHLRNKSYWVAAYLMDLEKFEPNRQIALRESTSTK